MKTRAGGALHSLAFPSGRSGDDAASGSDNILMDNTLLDKDMMSASAVPLQDRESPSIEHARAGEELWPGFTKLAGTRINTLRGAHDRIMQAGDAPVSLFKLIETEAQAYLNNQKHRVELGGADVLISPFAYTVMALVIHEMIANSVQYGALSLPGGRLQVHLTRPDNSDLHMAWREQGGPTLKPVQHRGFGLTIIEQSMPFELEGKAELRFAAHGLEADFEIPARYVFAMANSATCKVASDKKDTISITASPDRVPEHVLLVEDSVVIALDTEEVLRSLGVAQVDNTASVHAALEAIAKRRPDFAIVDLNLGSESGMDVIDELRRRRIPFVVATGYGETSSQMVQFAPGQIMNKPYDCDDILQALSAQG